MTHEPLKHIAVASAVEVCRHIGMSPEGRPPLPDGATPGEYLQRLLDARLYNDAVYFLAAALPPRLSVWWACLCIWKLAQEPPSPAEEAEMRAAVRWVLGQPPGSEEAAIDQPELSRPWGWPLRSARLCDDPAARIPPEPAVQSVAAGIGLAVAMGGAVPRHADLQLRCLRLGLAVAEGHGPPAASVN
jgi:hypothetical protein